MAEQLAWSYSIQAAGGPMVAGAGVMPVDGYTKLNVVVRSLLAASVGTLTFENQTDGDAEISILAGRDATPP